MNREVFIYAGPHRSGSQFLLTFVFSILPGLANMHTRDPDCNSVVWDAMDEHPMFRDTDAIRARIQAHLDRADDDKVLIGNEEFFGDYGHYDSDGYYHWTPFYDHQPKAQFMKEVFETPRIILTPRRQDLWFESAYMHFIHTFHTITIDEFMTPDDGIDVFPYAARSLKPCCDWRMLDWSVYIAHYHRLFGRENVLVVPHEVVLRDLNAAIDRFAAFIGVEPRYPETVPHVNRSMSKRAWRLALLLNRFVLHRRNRLGFIPTQPGAIWIDNRRKVRDNRLLWFLAGITRRISLHWFLSDVVGGIGYEKPDILGSERREMILAHYRDKNRRYAELIGWDLEPYGYY